jgi:hypothetical protein
MTLRTLVLFAAALLSMGAIGYASFTTEPPPYFPQALLQPLGGEAPATPAASAARDDSARPRQCDRSRNIDTDCTYE